MLRVQIDSMANGGAGIARVDGKVLFVAGAIEGDTAAVRITADKKTFAKAELVELITPSPYRRPSPCAVSASCGGCPFIAAQPSKQRLWKKDFAISSLAKLTGLSAAELSALAGDVLTGSVASGADQSGADQSGAGLGYRHRLTLKAGLMPEGDGLRLAVGFLSRRSHRIVATSTCPVATPAIQQVITALSAAALSAAAQAKQGGSKLKGRDRSEDKSKGRRNSRQSRRPRQGIYDIQLQEVHGSPAPMVIATFMTEGPHRGLTLAALLQAAPELRPLAAALKASPLVAWLGTSKDSESAPAFAYDSSDSQSYLTFPGLFQQAHLRTNRQMRAFVKTALAGCVRVLDLFCGTGNLSLGLDAKVTGIEGVPRSIAAAKLAAAQKPSHRYQAASAGDFLAKALTEARASAPQAGIRPPFDGIVSDPPRAGHGPLMADLIALSAPRLVLVGCDPMNLARDVAACLSGGYRLTALRVFDAFPHTSHVETIAVLDRGS